MSETLIPVLYGHMELRQEWRDGVCYGWSITYDRDYREVSRTQPTPLCRMVYE